MVKRVPSSRSNCASTHNVLVGLIGMGRTLERSETQQWQQIHNAPQTKSSHGESGALEFANEAVPGVAPQPQSSAQALAWMGIPTVRTASSREITSRRPNPLNLHPRAS